MNHSERQDRGNTGGNDPRISLLIEGRDKPGSLLDLLRFFWKYDVNLTHIDSRPASGQSFDFYVDCEGRRGDDNIDRLLADLKQHALKLLILDDREVPWFPRHVTELDVIANDTRDAGTELQSDHPGFNDPEYRQRRTKIDALARQYRHGEALPTVDYTAAEIATWGEVYTCLQALQERYACAEYLKILADMERQCGYAGDNIPQAADVSAFLELRTGFCLRPVAGLLGSRNFLNGLAFRTFFSTQYIRHYSRPLYTPEPDVCHELIGHAPMFADSAFADFSQEIGLASLGASDDDIEKLARCYWHSVEFGLLKEAGSIKAYGAGLLSSFGELEYACAEYRPAGDSNERPELRPWDPLAACTQEFPITSYQPLYFVADSLQDAKQRMREYCECLSRPFFARYNPATKTIWVDRAVRGGD